MANQSREHLAHLWLEQKISGYDPKNLCLISGDASFRRYFRYQAHDYTHIFVDAPPPNENCSKFVEIAQQWHEHGVPVPLVEAAELDVGFMLQEDLGDESLFSLFNRSTENAQPFYEKALDDLVRIRELDTTGYPVFDQAFVEREFGIFEEWYWGTLLDEPTTPEANKVFQQLKALFCEVIHEQPYVCMHRDYHSRNLMVQAGKLAIIDFQDAVQGPVTYDVVSLLRDCYVKLPQARFDELSRKAREDFQNQSGCDVDPEQWQRWIDITGFQRHLKAIGIFVRLHRRDGKSTYVNDIPLTLTYLQEVMERNHELAFAKRIFNERFFEKSLKKLESLA